MASYYSLINTDKRCFHGDVAQLLPVISVNNLTCGKERNVCYKLLSVKGGVSITVDFR